jgi:hypothetical protein
MIGPAPTTTSMTPSAPLAWGGPAGLASVVGFVAYLSAFGAFNR